MNDTMVGMRSRYGESCSVSNDIPPRVDSLRATLPPNVEIVAAAKMRTSEEVRAAVEAGITMIGHNYVQETGDMIPNVSFKAKWHLIGHLQRNKARDAAPLFDMVETLDSVRLANALETHSSRLDKVLPVLIEVNSGREENKTGALPEDVDALVDFVSRLKHLQLAGLMTMGPFTGDPEEARPYFVQTREIFERLSQAGIPNADFRVLSMGMSNSYRVAVEEGANLVRIGTGIFGPRRDK